jgi:arylsulfatase A-like enzyme
MRIWFIFITLIALSRGALADDNIFNSTKALKEQVDWVKANKDKKMSIFLHGYDAHGQHVPDVGFDYRFVDKGYDKKYTGSKEEQESLREEGLEKGTVNVRKEDVTFWRAIYDEKIQRTDADFKGFLEEYEKLGLTGKSIFILTSDHGTEFFEHNKNGSRLQPVRRTGTYTTGD